MEKYKIHKITEQDYLIDEREKIEEEKNKNTTFEENDSEVIPIDNIKTDSLKTLFFFDNATTPRQYQKDAIKKFTENDFQCLFAMATGTGKTLTSLFAANELSIQRKIKTVLILVPLKDLVVQWEKSIKDCFGGQIICVYSGTNWKEELETFNLIKLLKDNQQKSEEYENPLVIISTYDSYSLNDEKILNCFDTESSLIIADEVHKFGAETYSQKLPEKIKYRIGLSATPKRPYDDKGTKAIFDYFCPSENYYEFSIKDAIDNNMLCHYNYYPFLVSLTEY